VVEPQFQYTDLIKVPPAVLMSHEDTRSRGGSDGGPDGMIRHTYNDLAEHYQDVNYLADRAILTPLNTTARDMNNDILDKHWPVEDEITLHSTDSVSRDDENTSFPLEFLNSLDPASIPPHKLRLRPGVVLMVMCNLNRASGLCNGTRVIYRRHLNNVLEARAE